MYNLISIVWRMNKTPLTYVQLICVPKYASFHLHFHDTYAESSYLPAAVQDHHAFSHLWLSCLYGTFCISTCQNPSQTLQSPRSRKLYLTWSECESQSSFTLSLCLVLPWLTFIFYLIVKIVLFSFSFLIIHFLRERALFFFFLEQLHRMGTQ